ncbi:uncharacterized protein LOC132294555 [Cornus florida]|uniref:uncharacterized protein LOC132294555 n=1 Tax=Cornus florida TaxID=4283 RepID=UPI0028A16C0F|nr:uncharacterized protein LOC132294555 [Cornus florida]
MKELKTATNHNNSETSTPDLQNPNNGDPNAFSDVDIDSSCSTPYVSAPSSPGRGPPLSGFFYSAPASPIHFVLSSSHHSPSTVDTKASVFSSFDFEFSAKAPATGSVSAGSMSSADELFLNGQIRPMKLSSHLQRPQRLTPLLDLDETERDGDETDETEKIGRGRDVIVRDRSLRRRTRSMSPLRSTLSFQWYKGEIDDDDSSNQMDLSFEDVEVKQTETESSTTPAVSVSSSRSSSAGRSSKRWVFLKELLYRSKSEGRNNNHNHKFWSSISFSPIKDWKLSSSTQSSTDSMASSSTAETVNNGDGKKVKQSVRDSNKKPVAGKVGKKGLSKSAHEMHYTANRAQAEEMRKKTFLPYRQGLLGCLGLSSKSYDAMNGFVGRALNPVSSR